MAEMFSSGDWQVKPGSEQKFIKAWEEFLGWTRDNVAGFEHGHLVRDENDPRHFVSFAHWKDADSLQKWKSLPGFAERFGACRALCDQFRGGDFHEEVELSV